MPSSASHVRDSPYRWKSDAQSAAIPACTGSHKYAKDVESTERSRRYLEQRELQRLQVAQEQWVKTCWYLVPSEFPAHSTPGKS